MLPGSLPHVCPPDRAQAARRQGRPEQACAGCQHPARQLWHGTAGPHGLLMQRSDHFIQGFSATCRQHPLQKAAARRIPGIAARPGHQMRKHTGHGALIQPAAQLGRQFLGQRAGPRLARAPRQHRPVRLDHAQQRAFLRQAGVKQQGPRQLARIAPQRVGLHPAPTLALRHPGLDALVRGKVGQRKLPASQTKQQGHAGQTFRLTRLARIAPAKHQACRKMTRHDGLCKATVGSTVLTQQAHAPGPYQGLHTIQPEQVERMLDPGHLPGHRWQACRREHQVHRQHRIGLQQRGHALQAHRCRKHFLQRLRRAEQRQRRLAQARTPEGQPLAALPCLPASRSCRHPPVVRSRSTAADCRARPGPSPDTLTPQRYAAAGVRITASNSSSGTGRPYR